MAGKLPLKQENQIEESWIIKNFYEYHGFVHIGIEKYDHLPFTVGRMEWTVK